MITPICITVAVLLVAGILAGSSQFAARKLPWLIGLGAVALFVATLLGFGRVEPGVQLFPWTLGPGRMLVGFDALSGFFLLPLLLLSACSAWYGPAYLAGHKNSRFHWLWFSLLVAGMIVVLIARNAILFLLAWELMSLSSFLLVITDRKKQESIRAGWIYFVTAHIGTAFLLVLFFLISAGGSFDFASWTAHPFSPHRADLLFILALVAFGMKAGFIPFHVWLPLAHPEAPSHVSALMSGIMIKMGIYGILRILTFLAPFHGWWGGLLIGLGSISGIMGVLFAIGQHDLKRLLAYHSVENIGIILLGLGLGIVGAAAGLPLIALLGFSGALLHVVNHSLFKGLLFLGAGAVIKQTGSGEIDRLGGLIRQMPATALLFLAGSVAICGLPFFNGFVSEFLIYSAGITGVLGRTDAKIALWAVVAVLSLALIGGLAAACFTKVFGTVFLGEPRSPLPDHREVAPSMIASMALLAAACLVIGLCSVLFMPLVVKAASVFGVGADASSAAFPSAIAMKLSIALALILAFGLAAWLVSLLKRRGRKAGRSLTWDCGYAKPAPTMQYTASSFASPIVTYFGLPLAAEKKLSGEREFFPKEAWTFHSSVNDWFLDRIYIPAIRGCDRLFESLRWFQNGKSGHYVAYISLTILALLLWSLFV